MLVGLPASSHKHTYEQICFYVGTLTTAPKYCRHSSLSTFILHKHHHWLLFPQNFACASLQIFFFSPNFLLPLTPSQVWVDWTAEVSSQHATGTAASQGHCAHSKLDPGFGSFPCSAGKICSHKIAFSYWVQLPRAFFFIFIIVSNLLFLAAVLITWLWAQTTSK